ncbi:MAG: nucleotidyl transferase AbiEii/AbiGii toxin family protein [bacterium]
MENISIKNLLPAAEEVFNKLSNSELNFLNNFILVGGSALAIRLGHRQSEDLDFFTYENWFDKNKIFEALNLFKDKTILSDSKEQINLICGGVKISFVNTASNPEWQFLKPESNNSIGSINIATLDQLSAMKTHVLFLRSAFRDYYDLYILGKYHMNIEKIYNNAEKLIPGMTFRLFTTALTYVNDIKDENIEYLKPKYNVNKQEISSFFEKEIKNYIAQLEQKQATEQDDAFTKDLNNRLNKGKGWKR